MANLAEMFNAGKLLSVCAEFVVKMEIQIKLEDIKENPKLVMKILEHHKKEKDCLKKDLKRKDVQIINLVSINMTSRSYGRGYDSDDYNDYNHDANQDFTACDKECGYCGNCDY